MRVAWWPEWERQDHAAAPVARRHCTIAAKSQGGLLRIVYFDQNRVLDPTLACAARWRRDSDSVIYSGCVIHVASWAARFLLIRAPEPARRETLGGERAAY